MYYTKMALKMFHRIFLLGKCQRQEQETRVLVAEATDSATEASLD